MKRIFFAAIISGFSISLYAMQEVPTLRQLALQQVAKENEEVDMPEELAEKLIKEGIDQGRKIDLTLLSPELAKKAIAYQILKRRARDKLKDEFFMLLSFPGDHLEKIKKLLEQGINVNDIYNGKTALYTACFTQFKPKIIALLLEQGADPNALSVNWKVPYKKESPLQVLTEFVCNQSHYLNPSDMNDLNNSIKHIIDHGGKALTMQTEFGYRSVFTRKREG